MKRYRATMPKEPPPIGFSHVVYAVLNDKGERLEFTGLLPNGWASHNMESIIIDSRKKKDGFSE